VGGGSETEDEDGGVGVAEAGHGPAPVGLVAEGGTLLAGDALAPLDESRAFPAAGDPLL
jgi:hypothetical protein